MPKMPKILHQNKYNESSLEIIGDALKEVENRGGQLVGITHDFKFQAPDGKQRAAYALDAKCVQILA